MNASVNRKQERRLDNAQSGMSDINVSLKYFAETIPEKPAVVFTHGSDSSKGENISFSELHKRTQQLATGLQTKGITKGTKVLLLARPTQDFASVVFALDLIGAIPIFLDPGMGLKRILKCISRVEPEVLIGDPKVYLLATIFRDAFKSITVKIISQKSRFFPNATPLTALFHEGQHNVHPQELLETDLAAIVFTSGSTGVPKGVALSRQNINAQKSAWSYTLSLTENDIDLVTFPIFLLFSIASGRTCVIPSMNFSKPGHVDPKTFCNTINNNRPTFCFASPALWNKISKYAQEKGIQWPSLTCIASGGAPVPTSTLKRVASLAPNATIHTPYGATEALPISSISAEEIFQETAEKSAQGKGTCIGRATPGIDIKIIQDSDNTIPAWTNDLPLPANEVGEIVISGPIVTESYINAIDKTRESKIYQGLDSDSKKHQSVWHRTGDLGYLDENGRLWFCGRKAHKVRTDAGSFYSVQIEGLFNQLNEVWRSALVGVRKHNKIELAIIVELEKEHKTKFESIKPKIISLAEQHQLPIKYFLHHKKPFPVDKRHNAKIERPQLGEWATRKVN